MSLQYKHTLTACFAGYIVQAVVNNFVPLLFVAFQDLYGIPLAQITALITVNFGVQLAVDFLSAFFVDRIGYRASLLIAHGCSAGGLILLTVLPSLFGNAFAGLLSGVVVYAAGGGLLEVLISPVVEACPNEHKAQTMSLLHSFYCWGSAGVILISTLFFALFGTENWKIMALIWAALPVANGIFFSMVPLAPVVPADERQLSIKELFSNGMFWLCMALILCAGASEQAVSQWASTFAEQTLGLSKTWGDLAGPTVFALLMGLSRLLYGKFGEKIPPDAVLFGGGTLCIASYLLISLSPGPVACLCGVALCGFSVGVLWPCTFSKAAESVRGGGTAMFAFLALAGDSGCMLGPTVAGFIADAAQDNLQLGVLAAIIFPVVLTILTLILFLRSKKKKKKTGLP